MYEFRHRTGAQPCGQVACYAPASFFVSGAGRCVRADAAGWPTPIAPREVRCGACGVLVGAFDLTGEPTIIPIITRAERRRPERPGTSVEVTDALLAAPDRLPTLTAQEIATYLQVDPRVVTAAMESGELAGAYRVGRRGGVGEWRCPGPAAAAYLQRLTAALPDPAA
jgi:hypothetical protein